MNDINELFRRMARGEPAPGPAPTREEAEAHRPAAPPATPGRAPHGSADGGARGALDVRPTNEMVNEWFLEILRDPR
jgi:hypothetical protein